MSRKCPYCAELIPASSGRCRYCWSKVMPVQGSVVAPTPTGMDAPGRYAPDLSAVRQAAPAQVDDGRPGDPRFGGGLAVVGLLVTLFFFSFYETVAAPPRSTANPHVVGTIDAHDLNRVQYRRIGIVMGLGMLLAGLALGLPRPKPEAQEPGLQAVPEPRPAAPPSQSTGGMDWRSQANPRYLPDDLLGPG